MLIFFQIFSYFFMELQVYTIFYFILHKKKSYIKRMRWAMPPRLPGWVPGGGNSRGRGGGDDQKGIREEKSASHGCNTAGLPINRRSPQSEMDYPWDTLRSYPASWGGVKPLPGLGGKGNGFYPTPGVFSPPTSRNSSRVLLFD